jgi:hypothetical protein
MFHRQQEGAALGGAISGLGYIIILGFPTACCLVFACLVLASIGA